MVFNRYIIITSKFNLLLSNTLWYFGENDKARTTMIVTTTERIPGQDYEVIGEVFSQVTQSKNLFADIGASIKNLFGGEIKSYTDMQFQARQTALDRLKQECEKVGGDAVVMMRFDSGSIDGDMQFVVAYGTAVKYK